MACLSKRDKDKKEIGLLKVTMIDVGYSKICKREYGARYDLHHGCRKTSCSHSRQKVVTQGFVYALGTHRNDNIGTLWI